MSDLDGHSMMTSICIAEREISEEELVRVHSGFAEYAVEHGNPVAESERLAFVAMDGGVFVGCSSGLVYPKTTGYSSWSYITDLFVEKPYRGRGLGVQLLRQLEGKVASLRISNIWTWTAGYEAPGFYKKQGYEVFCEMNDWYTSGHSRIGFRKRLIR